MPPARCRQDRGCHSLEGCWKGLDPSLGRVRGIQAPLGAGWGQRLEPGPHRELLTRGRELSDVCVLLQLHGHGGRWL